MDTNKIDARIAELTHTEVDRLPWMIEVAIQAELIDEVEAVLCKSRLPNTATNGIGQLEI